MTEQTALPLIYPDAPGFKARGFPEPSPSQDAAIMMVKHVRRLRVMILSAMGSHDIDWTPDEMADWLGLSVLTVRPRFTELHGLRRIERTGERRPSISGHAQWVYRLAGSDATPAATAAANED